MKNTLFLVFIIALSVMVSCKNESKEKKVEPAAKTEKTPVEKTYKLIGETVNVGWTAYKTTEKTPVSGTFKDITIKDNKVGKNITEMINGIKFEIASHSIFSNNEERDQKLKASFFDQMRNTENINGLIVAKDMKSAYVSLTMNGLTAKLPIKFSNTGTKMKLTATMDLNTWKAQAAIKALNVVCGDLHKGADGVSKTWDEVQIDVSGLILIK